MIVFYLVNAEWNLFKKAEPGGSLASEVYKLSYFMIPLYSAVSP